MRNDLVNIEDYYDMYENVFDGERVRAINITREEEMLKSILLAKLMEWPIAHFDGEWRFAPKTFSIGQWIFGYGNRVPNLYKGSNMALAWYALNWANKQDFYEDLELWWIQRDYTQIYTKNPEEAIKLWLDKILELSQKFGLTKKLLAERE